MADEAHTGAALTDSLRTMDYEVALVRTGAEALTYLSQHKVAVVLFDLGLPDLSGQERYREILAQHNVPVIIFTSSAEIAGAAAALTAGVANYWTKPYEPSLLEYALRKVLEDSTKIDFERAKTRAALVQSVGVGGTIQKIVHEIESISETDLTVLLEGETGTGKELFARAIHNLSSRKNKPFIVVDCGAIPTTLFESELFGHQKGAFTGAEQKASGLLESANGGSLLLDEIDSLPLPIQSKLLRLIEAREYRPIGSSQMQRLDIRIIAGSGTTLRQLVETQQFRADLYYRLAECVLRIPPLRERKEDLHALTLRFMHIYNSEANTAAQSIASDALALLQRHHWPGNVRELRNTIRRTLLLAGKHSHELSPALFAQAMTRTEQIPANNHHAPCENPAQGHAAAPFCTDACPFHQNNPSWEETQPVPLTATVNLLSSRLTQWILRVVLKQTQGNKAQAARRLGIDYKTLCNKLQLFGDRD